MHVCTDDNYVVSIYSEIDALIATRERSMTATIGSAIHSESAEHTTTQWVGRGCVKFYAPLFLRSRLARPHDNSTRQGWRFAAESLRTQQHTGGSRQDTLPRYTRADHDQQAVCGTTAHHVTRRKSQALQRVSTLTHVFTGGLVCQSWCPSQIVLWRHDHMCHFSWRLQ